MKTIFNATWVEQVKRVQAPGEDLKYDEGFTQLKNQNGSMAPDAAWMLEKAAGLLTRSLDWRVCIYALHAAAIAGEIESFVALFSVLATIANEKFNESYPLGHHQKIATLTWCSSSYIVDHLKNHRTSFTRDQLSAVQNSLTRIYQAVLSETGETVRWHSLDDFLSTHCKKEIIKEVVAPVPSEEFKHSRESRPFFDKMIEVMLKEKQYERAISLSRAHRWCPLVVPKHNEYKTELDLRQQRVEVIQHKFDKGDWEAVVYESEDFFIQVHAHYFMKINYWSHVALSELGEKQAAESIIISLRKLYKNYGQIFNFMYNSGQLFADAETLAWIHQHCHETAVAAPKAECSTDQQWVDDKDVVSMKAWMHEHPIKNNKDRFIHDYLHLKLLKSERADLSLSAAISALFDRSIDEKLHAWEPALAEKIWAFYAEQLKEEKKQTKNNNLSLWQAQWDHLTKTIASTHVPAALQLLQQF